MRVAMYWHNGRSLGHTAITGRVAHALIEEVPGISLAGLSGAYRGLDLLPDQMDLTKLPAYVNYDRRAGWDTSGRQGLDAASLFRARSELAEVFLRHYAPEVLIVDHVPRGTENELELALTRNRSGLRVLGLRGILFDREKTARHYFGPEASRWIADHFDAILVYIDPAIHALEDSYEVPAALKERIHYTGYLAEPSASSRAEARQTLGVEPGQRLVVASMGGGQGALPIWTRVIEALRDNVRRFDRAYVVTGPYLEAADLAALREVATREPWLTVAAYEARLGTWMAAADLVIGAAGSNMLGEILATRCNAIAVPRQVREPEQHMHATRLAERGLIRTRDLDAVLDHGLTDVVAEALTEPLEPNQAVMLGGARRYASHVAQLWSQR